jgi:FkbM family methyltransferase
MGTFRSPEPEYAMLGKFVEPGDWIVDVGANVGHYSKRFSELVGSTGRVIAFEPVPETFAILVANLARAKRSNVTLINAAASDQTQTVKMVIPFASTGIRNLQESHLLFHSEEAGFEVLALDIDSLRIPHRISLVKIDAEGHEFGVLSGMLELIRRDLPILFVETGTPQVTELLSGIGYSYERLEGSPNKIFRAVHR